MSQTIWERINVNPKDMTPEEAAYLRGFLYEYNKNMARFESKASQDYFHNLISAIMLEYKKSYENHDIRIPYRIKSVKSVLNKIAEYLNRDDKSRILMNTSNNFQLYLNEELSDMFGMTIVAGNRPPVLASRDPEIQKLIDERETNRIALASMQKYKLGITEDEFLGRKDETYNFNGSRAEYYLRCIFLLNKIKTLVHPDSTKLLEKYDTMLNQIKGMLPERFFDVINELVNDKSILERLDTKEKLETHLDLIRIKMKNCDMTPEERKWLYASFSEVDITLSSDFSELLDDFSARIDDRLDLAILSKQVHSIFETSDLLNRFGIKLLTPVDREKRTKNGYVANFLVLKTPYGKIEIQLQSEHEHKEGYYGYSAHSSIEGKDMEPFEIPKKSDKEGLKRFRQEVAIFSARKFEATFDKTEKERVLIKTFGKYQNYLSIMMQVQRGTKKEKEMEKYFREVYAKKDWLFLGEAKQDSTQGFVPTDIELYLEEREKETSR